MKVGDDIVATVHVEKDKLKILWHDETWKEWRELHDSDEMKELFETGNKKLKQAAENKTISGKGKGAGKSATV